VTLELGGLERIDLLPGIDQVTVTGTTNQLIGFTFS
jgi:hypothetical protein